MNRVNYWRAGWTDAGHAPSDGRPSDNAGPQRMPPGTAERRQRPRDEEAARALADPSEAWREFERLLAAHRPDIL
jgi:hypothetical protein